MTRIIAFISGYSMNKCLFDPNEISRRQLADRLGTTEERILGMERRGCPCRVVKDSSKGYKSRIVRFDILKVLEWLRACEVEKKANRPAFRRAEQSA